MRCLVSSKSRAFSSATLRLPASVASRRWSASPNARIVCGFQEQPGAFVGGGIELSTLIVVVGSASGRPVLDKTGLSGQFDVDLKWTPALGADAPAGDTVSIFTAVQEQLGLKLEYVTAPLDVLVLDRIERPSEN